MLKPRHGWAMRGRARPRSASRARRALVSLKLVPGKDNAHFAIWSRHGSEWRFAVAPISKTEWSVPDGASAVVVSAVDRLGVEGERLSVWRAGEQVATAP
ncbi:hypothetical protein LP420_21010 [Massilia sp. B-10]|nr:hypothetical protein LP420_21010 [Massilia sp. B-10]